MFFSKRFFPFFNTFFFGAFNDNVFRSALVILITYHSGYSKEKASALSFLAMALLMLPQFPFSALAGEIADKFQNARLFRLIKACEIAIMLFTLAAFIFSSVPFLLVLLFLMGTQSAFFSPLKYAYIPRNVPDELVRGNAFVNAGTYIAILLGTVAGNLIISIESRGRLVTGVLLVLFAVSGYAASRFIPPVPPASPEDRLDFNIPRGTWRILKLVFADSAIRKCALGLSVFWMAGALYVSQLAGFCKEVIGGDETLVMAFTLLFSAGVALGSWLCAFLGRRLNLLRFVPFALVLMGLFTLDLYFASLDWRILADAGVLLSPIELARIGMFWRFTADLFLLALCGGFYSVPLMALIQKRAAASLIAKIAAGNNIVNAAAIGIGTLGAALLMCSGLITVKGIFVLIGCLNFAAAAYLASLRKESV